MPSTCSIRDINNLPVRPLDRLIQGKLDTLVKFAKPGSIPFGIGREFAATHVFRRTSNPEQRFPGLP